MSEHPPPENVVSRTVHRRRRATALLALFALLLGLVSGTTPAGMVRSEVLADGLTRILVCSPGGARVVYLDEQGRERPPPAEDPPRPPGDCQLCQRLSCAKISLLAPVAVPVVGAPPAQRLDPSTTLRRPPEPRRAGDPRPRAPPFLLRTG